MNWFNLYGLIIIANIMLPNIMYAGVNKQNKSNCYKNKFVILLEQVGRYGCMFFMIFNIPFTYFNFWFNYAFYVYVGVNGAFCFAYIILWVICWNKNNLLKALSLSIIPSVMFLFSGVMLLNIPLIVFSVVFAYSHILISYKNEKLRDENNGNK